MSKKKDKSGEEFAGFMIAIIVSMFVSLFEAIATLICYNKENKEKKELENKINKTQRLNEEINEITLRIENLLLENNNIEAFDCNEYYDSKLKKLDYYAYEALPKPELNLIKKENKCIKKNIILEKIFKLRKEKRLKQEKECQAIFEDRISQYQQNEEKRLEEYYELRKEFTDKVAQYNENIENKKENFINKNKEEFEKVLKEFIEKNIKDKIYDSIFSIKYIPHTKSCVLNYYYKNTNIIPIYKEYKLNKNADEPIGIKFKESEIKDMYEDYINKVTLKMISIVFKFSSEYIADIVFNGYLNSMNQATGTYEDFLILSVTTTSEYFSKLNLTKVNPNYCLKELQCRRTKSLSHIKSITPFEKADFVDCNDMLLQNIDIDIDGFEFEKISKDLLIANGFNNVEVTSCSGDFGADVIAYKNDIKYAIQCKKYTKTVGVKAIQEVMGSKSIYGCHVAVVLTNNYFTRQAKKLAEENNVLLWDRDVLKKLLEQYNVK